jgi:hypothetical protein
MDEERERAGDQPEGDQVAFLREGELDTDDEVTDTELDEGETDSDAEGALESLTELDLRSGETGDAEVAAEEGMTWVPPVDPPVIPSDDPGGIEIAAGFGVTGDDGQGDDEEDMSERVREALRADAATSRYADELAIGAINGVVALRGVVDDIEDSDNVLEVASGVSGVSEVIDELDVRALE